MEIKKWLANGPVTAAIGLMAFIPVMSMTMVAQTSTDAQSACTTPTVMPEARNLLNDIWRDAEQVARGTGSLENFADSPSVDRTMQDDQLQNIQAKVEDMDNRLSRLEEIEQSLPPSARKAIDEVTPLVQYMATNTAAALGDLNANIQYGGYAQILNDEAQTIEQDINTGEQSADLRLGAAYDQENLGMLPVFGK